MVARASWLLLALPAVPLLCLQLRSAGLCPGWKDIFLLGGRGLLFLAVLTLIVLVTTPWLTSHTPSQVCPTVTEDENKRRQKRARKQQQETLRSQSSEYLENILKPRQEMKLRKQQERFYQMMGESWKAQDGHKLGGHEEPRSRLAQDDGAPGDTPNKEASKRRKLPEPVTCESASAGQQPRVKKVLVLPEEPPETAKEVVAVALRCPDGRVCRRRFHTWWRSQVLLDWMVKVGYPSSTYALSASYPRRPLDIGDQTLEDTGLTADTVLNVEEKEPGCGEPSDDGHPSTRYIGGRAPRANPAPTGLAGRPW